MSTTILERGMLKTRVPERGMDVTTVLHAEHRAWRPHRPCPPWTAVWVGAGPALAWLRFWDGLTTQGGLAEAHEWVVEQVRRCVLPAPEP